MKSLAIASLAILFCISADCSRKQAPPPASPMKKCQDEVKAIPEAAVFAKSQRPQTQDRPLEGMELALTINGMIQTAMSPEEDEDDWCYTENTRQNFDGLIAALKQNDMPPVVDFVYGQSLDQELGEEWLRNGNLLGTFGFAYQKVKKESAERFMENVARGDAALAAVWSKFPAGRKYFRYPVLKSYPGEEKQAQISAALKAKGYVEVPATIDARDGLLSQPYCAALTRGDDTCAGFIRQMFKSLLLDKTVKAREAARSVAGTEIKHVLMVRADQLTFDMLGDILAWYKNLGARFVPLDDVLRDRFYHVNDPNAAARAVLKETLRAELESADPR